MSEQVAPERLELIRELRPQADAIYSLGSGDINDVVLVGNAEIFRFPKNQEGQQSLRYEAIILDELVGKVTLQIPEVKSMAPDGSYGIFSYIAGDVLSSEEIIALNTEQKLELAKSIAGFMREVNSSLSLEEVGALRAQYMPWFEDEETYYSAKLTWGTGTPYHDLYKQYYEKFLSRRAQIGEPAEYVIFGDIHYGNMLFNDAKKLVGIIDFGDCGPGTIYNDIRQLYRLGEDIVQMLITELNGDFGTVDLELVRLNAIMHEISILLRPESQPPHHNPRADLAHNLLSAWLGNSWMEHL